MLGQRQGQRGGHGGLACGGWLGSDVLLRLGGGRGRGETEQRAEASRGGLRRPKLMGGHCGDHVVKYTCESHSRNGKEGGREGRGRADTSGKEGTEREARTEPGCAKRQASL